MAVTATSAEPSGGMGVGTPELSSSVNPVDLGNNFASAAKLLQESGITLSSHQTQAIVANGGAAAQQVSKFSLDLTNNNSPVSTSIASDIADFTRVLKGAGDPTSLSGTALGALEGSVDTETFAELTEAPQNFLADLFDEVQNAFSEVLDTASDMLQNGPDLIEGATQQEPMIAAAQQAAKEIGLA